MRANRTEADYIKQGLERLGFKSLREYYRTDEWRALRASLLLPDSCCTACQSKENLALHHPTYKNLGTKEDRNTVIWLCKECHYNVHILYDWKEGSLYKCTFSYIKEPFVREKAERCKEWAEKLKQRKKKKKGTPAKRYEKDLMDRTAKAEQKQEEYKTKIMKQLELKEAEWQQKKEEGIRRAADRYDRKQAKGKKKKKKSNNLVIEYRNKSK